MAPLMHLGGDEIVEASLLEPAVEEHRTFPIPEEETTLLGEEPEPPETPKVTSLPEGLEIPEPTEPSEQINAQPMESTEQTDTPSASPPASPMPSSSQHPSQKIKKFWQGIEADPNNAGEWDCPYMQKDKQVPNWWKEFRSLLHSNDEHFSNVQVKGMA